MLECRNATGQYDVHVELQTNVQQLVGRHEELRYELQRARDESTNLAVIVDKRETTVCSRNVKGYLSWYLGTVTCTDNINHVCITSTDNSNHHFSPVKDNSNDMYYKRNWVNTLRGILAQTGQKFDFFSQSLSGEKNLSASTSCDVIERNGINGIVYYNFLSNF